MKKHILILLLLWVDIAAYSQVTPVTKNMALLEIATGTWCVYCPGAALAADQMIAEGLNVAVIENHSGDSYQTQGSIKRINYYGFTAFPSAVFNGTIKHIGGGTANIYSTYRPIYNKSVVETTVFNFSLELTHISDNQYNAHIEVLKFDYYTNDTIKLHLIITESEIQQNWQGQSHLNFVNRMHATNLDGYDLCLSCSGTYSIDIPFTINSNWNLHHLEAVAFLQDERTKEVLQVDKKPVPLPVVKADVKLTGITGPEPVLCGNTIVPSATIQNLADVTLTEVTVKYWVNSLKKSSFVWTGQCLPKQSFTVNLPELEFSGANGLNTFNIELEKPNGFTDENPGQETQSMTFFQANQKTRFLEIETNTDYNGEETSWNITNMEGKVLYSQNQFESGQTYRHYAELENNQCYRFNLTDNGNNGFTDGSLRLLDYYSQKLIMQFQNFESDTTITFQSNYNWSKTFFVRNNQGNSITNGQTLYNEGFSGDSIFGLSLKIDNYTPMAQQLKLETEFIKGSPLLKTSTNWPQNNLQTPDTLTLLGTQSNWIFKTHASPNHTVDSCLIKYTIWADNDTVDKLEFYIWHFAKEQPPVKLFAMNPNGEYFQNTDTLKFTNYLSASSQTEAIWIANESSIPVNVKVKKTANLASSNHQINFKWGNYDGITTDYSPNSVTISPTDTNKTFSFLFEPETVGTSLFTFTFYNEQNPVDSLTATYLFEVLPNPNWVIGLQSSDGETISDKQIISLQAIETEADELTIPITLTSSSQYPVKVSLYPELLSTTIGNNTSVTWNNKDYDVRATNQFDTLWLNPGETISGPTFSIKPPFSPESASVNFKLYNPQSIENTVEYSIEFNIIADTNTTNGNTDFEALNGIEIFPNPAENEIYFQLTNNPTPQTGKTTGSILNALGQCVGNMELSAQDNKINIDALQPGLYQLILHSNGQTYLARFYKF